MKISKLDLMAKLIRGKEMKKLSLKEKGLWLWVLFSIKLITETTVQQ